MKPELMTRLNCWLESGCSAVAAASVVEVEGSTPHPLGMALLVNEHGEVAGALSGGCVDGAVVRICDEVLKSGRPRSLDFSATDDPFGDPALICGGRIRVWIYQLPNHLLVRLARPDSADCLTLIGALGTGPTTVSVAGEDWPEGESGHLISRLTEEGLTLIERPRRGSLVIIVGQSGFTNALINQATLLGHEVILCEPRERFAHPGNPAVAIVSSQPDTCILSLAGRLDSGSAVIVCTHDSKFDEPALLAALQTRAGYIAALGSRRTVHDRNRRLKAKGVSEEGLSRIHSPAGLDLGGITPEETALSIFAEWIACQRPASHLPLRETTGSIHGC